MCEVSKTFTDDEAEYMTQLALTIDRLLDMRNCELRSDKDSYWRPCSVDRTVGDSPASVCLWRPAAWTNTPKRREHNCTQWYIWSRQLIIKDCARRFVLKLYRHEASRGLFATDYAINKCFLFSHLTYLMYLLCDPCLSALRTRYSSSSMYLYLYLLLYRGKLLTLNINKN